LKTQCIEFGSMQTVRWVRCLSFYLVIFLPGVVLCNILHRKNVVRFFCFKILIGHENSYKTLHGDPHTGLDFGNIGKMPEAQAEGLFTRFFARITSLVKKRLEGIEVTPKMARRRDSDARQCHRSVAERVKAPFLRRPCDHD